MSGTIKGVYQLENGNWAYRFTRTVDGKRVNHKKTKDQFGNIFKTQQEAYRAKVREEYRLEAAQNEKPKRRMTVQEVFEEYCEKGRCGKAYSTIKKQDSLWRNHISVNFGGRYILTTFALKKLMIIWRSFIMLRSAHICTLRVF